MRRFALLLLTYAVLLACDDDSPSGPRRADRTPLGTWGAERVRLSVTELGAVFRTFCAEGDIERPILLDADGAFDLAGTLVVTAGPAVFYENARYMGRTDGRRMTLTVVGSSGGPTLGPYTLIFGQEASIPSCPIVAY